MNKHEREMQRDEKGLTHSKWMSESEKAQYRCDKEIEHAAFPHGSNATWELQGSPKFPWWLFVAFMLFAALCVGLVLVSVYGEVGP